VPCEPPSVEFAAVTEIAAARVYTAAGWLGPSVVHTDGDAIVSIEPLASGADVPERIVVPGFVDLQVNGIDAIDVASADGADWDALDAALVVQGVTTWCPTLITSRLDRYVLPLARIAARRRTGGSATPRPSIAGAHLEGPFLGGAPGAHRRDLLAPVDLDFLAALPDDVALVTLAPELAHAVEATRLLVERGALVSLGHTTATDAEFGACVDAGARLTTHLFNGMSGLHHREPGVAASALAEPRISASLIADGVHVHPRMLRLAFDLLGDRAVLVTDAVAWRAGTAGPVRVELRDGAPRLTDGTLAGSALAMDAAVRVCVEQAAVPLHRAVHAASTRPAQLLGLHDRGDVAVGRRADLVALDADMHVESVWIGGVLTG
jgi:N-acetylglucosamine-6-phosphate deacetylase